MHEPTHSPGPRQVHFWTDRARLFAYLFLLRVADLLLLLPRPRLLYAYLVIWFLELRHSPYRWPRSFEAIRLSRQAGQSPRELVYGETPLVTGVWLFWRAGLRRGHHLVDPCAGRGRALLAARWLGARATGYELLREHVELVTRPLRWAGVSLVHGDGATADLRGASHVYLTWTGHSQHSRARFETGLQAIPAGSRVIAIDAPVGDTERFRVVSRHEPLFTWGHVPVWVLERRPASTREALPHSRKS
jgi:hypothetical protein